MPAKVFIAHAYKDRAAAARLAIVLPEQGFDTFLADEDIPPGEKVAERLRSEIDQSNMFLMVKSVTAGTSSSVQMELGAAWARDKPIVFVIPPDTGAPDISMPLDFAAASVLRMEHLSDHAIGAAVGDTLRRLRPESAIS